MQALPPKCRLGLAFRALLLAALALLTLACAGGPRQQTEVRPCTQRTATGCNGSQALCDRRYDEVAYATTHNAMSSRAEGWWAANQQASLEQQLEDGVRALMLDTHYFTLKPGDPKPYLCHKICLFGATPLAHGLRTIGRFLDSHPREVVTIIFESHVSPEDTAQAFQEAGLLRFLHAQPQDAPWPTLGEMVGANRRLVVMTDKGGGRFPWYHDEFRVAWENPYQVWRDDGFDCGVNRGDARNPLFVLNHFITDPLPDRKAAGRVNRAAELLRHARRCSVKHGRPVNFVTVDHYDLGDLLEVVDELNGVGRLAKR